MRKTAVLFCVSAFLISAPALFAVQPPLIELKLDETENYAQKNSHRLKSAEADYQASEKKAQSISSRLLPKLVLEGNYQYFTNVSEIKIPIQGLGSIKLGDINNYSIGPSLYWTMWDNSGIRSSYESARELAASKKMEKDIIGRQVLLAARSGFFQAGLAKQEVVLFSDALKLAQSEYADIKINVRAGAKSRKDEISAHQEVLSKMRHLRQARSDLSEALNELASITGVSYGDNITLPMDASFMNSLPDGIGTPTVYVSIESEDLIIPRFKTYGTKKLWEGHPEIEMYEKLARSAELLSKSASSGLWPKFELNAKSFLEYPNGPILQTINQNTIGVNLTWAIFEGNDSRAKARENELIRESDEELKEQKKVDLNKDWQNINAELSNLYDQAALNIESVKEARELSDMVYKSYKIGSATFIEVEDANYKLLDAQIQFAKTKFQILVNLATLASLSE